MENISHTVIKFNTSHNFQDLRFPASFFMEKLNVICWTRKTSMGGDFSEIVKHLEF